MAAGHRRRRRVASLTATSTASRLPRSGPFHVLPGHGSFRGLSGSASRNLASGRLAPLCPERGQLDNERRSEELGVAIPRPGWDASPPRVGGTREPLWLIRLSRHAGKLAPAVFAAVAPHPVHDDRKLARNSYFGAADANPLG